MWVSWLNHDSGQDYVFSFFEKKCLTLLRIKQFQLCAVSEENLIQKTELLSNI